MEFETVTGTRIERRFPKEIRIRTYIVAPIFLVGAYMAIFVTNQHDVALLALGILLFFFVINHGLDWGYQLSADEEWIYQRPKGWRWFFRHLPWYGVRIDDIRRMKTIFGADEAIKERFFPFEFILIYGKSGQEGDNVVIYPPAFNDSAIKAFLQDLYERKPDVFAEDVVDYMYSDRPL